jgi:hypothetical protein
MLRIFLIALLSVLIVGPAQTAAKKKEPPGLAVSDDGGPQHVKKTSKIVARKKGPQKDLHPVK